MPYVTPFLSGDVRRADETISLLEAMRGKKDAWLVVGIHDVGSGTHNSLMDTTEHRDLIDWIATQHAWLEVVPMLTMVRRNLIQRFES